MRECISRRKCCVGKLLLAERANDAVHPFQEIQRILHLRRVDTQNSRQDGGIEVVSQYACCLKEMTVAGRECSDFSSHHATHGIRQRDLYFRYPTRQSPSVIPYNQTGSYKLA